MYLMNNVTLFYILGVISWFIYAF